MRAQREKVSARLESHRKTRSGVVRSGKNLKLGLISFKVEMRKRAVL